MSRVGISSGMSLSGALTAELISTFQFRLTRGDGAALGLGYSVAISVLNSAGGSIGISYSYDAGSGYWTVFFDDPSDVDPNGHWVRYNCEDGILTQYPYRYKSEDKGAVIDLIDPGVYEDDIPYWVVEGEVIHPTLSRICVVEQPASCIGRGCENNDYGGVFNEGVATTTHDNAEKFAFQSLGDKAYKRRTIKSSVPYRFTTRLGSTDVPRSLYGRRPGGVPSYCFYAGQGRMQLEGDGVHSLLITILDWPIPVVTGYVDHAPDISGRTHELSAEDLSLDTANFAGTDYNKWAAYIRKTVLYYRYAYEGY